MATEYASYTFIVCLWCLAYQLDTCWSHCSHNQECMCYFVQGETVLWGVNTERYPDLCWGLLLIMPLVIYSFCRYSEFKGSVPLFSCHMCAAPSFMFLIELQVWVMGLKCLIWCHFDIIIYWKYSSFLCIFVTPIPLMLTMIYLLYMTWHLQSCLILQDIHFAGEWWCCGFPGSMQ